MTATYPVPVKINVIIVSVCTVLFFTLLYAGAHTHQWGIRLLLGFAFGIVMIPVYSLIHEASHHSLHSNPWWDTFLGRWLCCMFIVPFTFYRHCHLKHHKKNRTDEEMWDLYYPTQSKWRRHLNLYLMMAGFGYLALWLAVVLFAISPRLLNAGIFKKHTEIRGFLDGIDDPNKLSTAQWESWVVILFQVGCWWWMDWNIASWLVLYLVNGLIWSSQNYVNHAFSQRDIINGAHNLKVPVWLNLIYLNFNLHLAHHQNPQIPWVYLPRFVKTEKGRFSFFINYFRLWSGPRMTKEESPKRIND